MNNDHSRQETIDAGFQEVTGLMIQVLFPGCSEVLNLQEDPPAGVSGAPTENNIMLWNAVIFGPHETPFEVSLSHGYKVGNFNPNNPSTIGILTGSNPIILEVSAFKH